MKIGEFITSVAVVVFVLSLCIIESLSLPAIVMMIVSGSWIVGYSFVMEEEKRMREGR